MDGVIFSCEVQQIKPEADIYETLLSRFGLKPEESVFLDDRPENCEAARKLGIHAIEFHDLKQAAKNWRSFGVKIDKKQQNRKVNAPASASTSEAGAFRGGYKLISLIFCNASSLKGFNEFVGSFY